MRYVFGQRAVLDRGAGLLMFSWADDGRAGARRARGLPCPARHPASTSLPPAAGRWAERAIEALTAAFGAYLAWSGLRFLDMTGGSVSAAIGYPIEILHALAPVAGGLICLFASWR